MAGENLRDVENVRAGIQVKGIVQGVGFRPFVVRTATRLGLGGFVRNEGGWVYIEVFGPWGAVKSLIGELRENPPPLARVDEVLIDKVLPGEALPGEAGAPGQESRLQSFKVVESRAREDCGPGIPPDSALCRNCREELMDPSNRRYLYPFINCVDCGPRFTIVEGAPYDRTRTSMKKFPMCEVCRKEYLDPSDRRFHAEPDACWSCGPRAFLSPDKGARVYSDKDSGYSWLWWAQEALLSGKVVAIKGVGGFHIACNALDSAAVRRLREKKKRPHKPLAIMVKDLDKARQWFFLDPQEESLLTSAAAPIVILRKKPGCLVVEEVAPGLDHIGVMLPYSPLHFLLFQSIDGREAPLALVMTSGNGSGLPLAFEDKEAQDSLGSLVDGFILHNRDIVRPCDDSVLRVVGTKPVFYRRSRGYVPREIPLRLRNSTQVFGAGAEGKNTFCLLSQKGARLSQHVGDLFNEESLSRYAFLVKDFMRLYRFEPEILAMDLHPGYEVNQLLNRMFPDQRVIKVQHHHAHMASVLAECGVTGQAVGIILDGTGYGTDGEVWGGEILYGDAEGFERLYHLGYVRMPGGEKAVTEPWRMALSYLKEAYGDDGRLLALRLFPAMRRNVEVLWPLIEWEGYPRTSSAGRLFDGVAALCGVSSENSYDGESSSLLGEDALRAWEKGERGNCENRPGESVFTVETTASFPDKLESFEYSSREDDEEEGDPGTIPLSPLISRVVEGLLAGRPKEMIALDFHRHLAETLTFYTVRAARAKRTEKVVLSGGVFQNPVFLMLLSGYLKQRGMEVFWPHLLPPNDGGISLGQAFVGAHGGGERACV